MHLKSKYETIEALNVDDFPKMGLDIIKLEITFGTYQLTQSWSYLAEHFKNGKYEIMINKAVIDSKKDLKLLHAKIQSRHVKRTKYNVFIGYESNKTVKTW